MYVVKIDNWTSKPCKDYTEVMDEIGGEWFDLAYFYDRVCGNEDKEWDYHEMTEHYLHDETEEFMECALKWFGRAMTITEV